MRALLRTECSFALLAARLAAGQVILSHGLKKSLGLFGGPGFSGTMDFFTRELGIPWVFALLAIFAGVLRGLGLVLGFLPRIAALGVAAIMVVAMAIGRTCEGGCLDHGFFMGWAGTGPGEGFEYHLLMIGLCLAVLIGGAGALSVDRTLRRDPARGPSAAGAPG